MKKTLLLLPILFLATIFTFSQTLVNVIAMASRPVSQVQSYLNAYGWNYSNINLNPVNSFKVIYNTTDVHGNSTVASGAVYIPQMNSCSHAPILVYEHGTEFRRTNVPSNNKYVGQGLYFSTTGYITVMPDYLGLGDNQGIHLYQHAETEATATLDLIKAVREYLDTASNTIQDNGELFLTGYSHGGHAAMATNKYIEENNLTSDFKVIASAPLSGAYDQTGAQFDLIFDGDSNYYASVFLPYILASYQEAYGDLYQNYNEIYDASHATNIESYINSANKTGAQWMVMLGTNYYNFMQDSVIQNILADTDRDSHPINIALRKNNVYDWVPLNPVRMLYCGNDSMVSPVNSTVTLDTMISLGATEVEALNVMANGDHNSCFIPATTHALAWFDSLSTKCGFSGIEQAQLNEISVYPNPTTSHLNIEGIHFDDVHFIFSSTLGQNYNVNKLDDNRIDMKDLPVGIYFLSIYNNESNLIVKRIKVMKK